MNIALTTPALATLALGALALVGSIVEAVVTRKVPSLFESAMYLLVLLVLLPYTVNCMVVGECNWYACLLVAAVTLLGLFGIVGANKKRRQEEK